MACGRRQAEVAALRRQHGRGRASHVRPGLRVAQKPWHAVASHNLLAMHASRALVIKRVGALSCNVGVGIDVDIQHRAVATVGLTCFGPAQDTLRRRVPVPSRLEVKARQAQAALRGDTHVVIPAVPAVAWRTPCSLVTDEVVMVRFIFGRAFQWRI